MMSTRKDGFLRFSKNAVEAPEITVRDFVVSRVLPGISYDQGLRIADRIHSTGRAIVWSGHKELAELYWSGLRDSGLTMAPLEC